MIKVKQLNESKESNSAQPYKQNRVFDANGLSPCLDTEAGRFSIAIKSATKDGFETAKEGDAINLSIPNSATPRGRVGNQQAQTLDTQSNQAVIVAQRGRNPNNSSDRTKGAPMQQRLEPNTQGTPNTLTSVAKDNLLTSGISIRRLTPIECCRLQGFPDTWTLYGNYNGVVKEVSQTQRYKLMGNAVTVDVVELIGRKLLKHPP